MSDLLADIGRSLDAARSEFGRLQEHFTDGSHNLKASCSYASIRFKLEKITDHDHDVRDLWRLYEDSTNVQFTKGTKKIELRQAIFPGKTSFEDILIDGDCLLHSCIFLDEARFNTFTVNGDANFARSEFIKSAIFYGAHFRKTAIFRQCRFLESANFKYAEFERSMNMDATQFFRTPDLQLAKFGTPPIVGSALFFETRESSGQHAGEQGDPRPALFRNPLFPFYREQYTFQNLQRLKEFALMNGDVAVAKRLSIWETQARRFWVDGPVPSHGSATKKAPSFNRERLQLPSYEEGRKSYPEEAKEVSRQFSSAVRFWLVLIYGLLSKYGLSISRPFILLIFVTSVFGCLYFQLGSEGYGRSRDSICSLERAAAVYTISTSFFGFATERRMQRDAANCLLGEAGHSRTTMAATVNERKSLSLVILSTFQRLLSALMLFLVVLGIRNNVRVES